ncbi:MAG: hypothetical protein AABW57_01280 [Nanoarchaeota archaeon]
MEAWQLDLTDISNKLKSKKELKDLDANFIKSRILEYLSKNKVDLDNERGKSYRLMFKYLRKKLREIYGSFRVIKETRDLEVYRKIFNEFKPKSVLDLGCGLEPLKYTTIYPKLEYYCFDIDKEEISRLNDFFKKNKINGRAFLFSLVDNNLDELPKVDLCLILRVLEGLESIKKNFSLELLSKIKAKFMVVSFAKIALGKKERIRKAGRSWFRRILRELNYSYEVLDYDDEIFFIIKK